MKLLLRCADFAPDLFIYYCCLSFPEGGKPINLLPWDADPTNCIDIAVVLLSSIEALIGEPIFCN